MLPEEKSADVRIGAGFCQDCLVLVESRPMAWPPAAAPENTLTNWQRPQVPGDLPQTEKAETDDYLKIGSYGGGSDHFTKYGPGIYGFNWWFNGYGRLHPEQRTWPDAPAEIFMSIGFGGNCAAMIPSQHADPRRRRSQLGQNQSGRFAGTDESGVEDVFRGGHHCRQTCSTVIQVGAWPHQMHPMFPEPFRESAGGMIGVRVLVLRCPARRWVGCAAECPGCGVPGDRPGGRTASGIRIGRPVPAV